VQGVDVVIGLAAVYSCVRFIADAIASLPIHVYRKTAEGPQLIEHSQLLENPSADMNTTMYDWLFQCISSALLWGNAWGLISSRTGVTSPNGLGYPQTIEWLPPEDMVVEDDTIQPWNPLKARIYLAGRQLTREELVHVRAFVIPGRTQAISPLRAFIALFQQGVEALGYSASWFRNGGFPPGTFQNLAEEVDAEQAREIRRRLTDTLRSREPLVYGKDWDYKPVVVPPSEAAFVEAMQLNATQIAAIYGVPPTKVGGRRGDSLTYATVAQETLSLITDTLRPWLVRLEHLLTSLLPATQYARFNTDALLKTDVKTRWDIYKVQRDMGAVTVDEMRRKEDMPPLPGGLGGETIPLDAMVRMAATTRAIPKSMIPQLTIEAELIANLLKTLQGEGFTPEPGSAPAQGAPGQVGASPGEGQLHPAGGGPQVEQIQGLMTPEQYLAHQLVLGRNLKNATGGNAAVAGRGDEITGFFGLKHHRCTLADRKRASVWIDDAASCGCFADEHEYEERIYKASRARIKGQLDDLVVDLPPENELAGPPQPAGTGEGHEPAFTFGPQALALLQGRNPALLNGTH